VIRFCFIVLLINIVSFFVKGRLLLRIKNKTPSSGRHNHSVWTNAFVDYKTS